MDRTIPDLTKIQIVQQSLRTLCSFDLLDMDACRNSWAIDSLVRGGQVCRSCSRSEVGVGSRSSLI